MTAASEVKWIPLRDAENGRDSDNSWRLADHKNQKFGGMHYRVFAPQEYTKGKAVAERHEEMCLLDRAEFETTEEAKEQALKWQAEDLERGSNKLVDKLSLMHVWNALHQRVKSGSEEGIIAARDYVANLIQEAPAGARIEKKPDRKRDCWEITIPEEHFGAFNDAVFQAQMYLSTAASYKATNIFADGLVDEWEKHCAEMRNDPA